MEKENKKTIEIPFGAKDSELYRFEYSIPEGYEAEIKDGKVIVTKKDSEDERIRKALLRCCDDWEKGQFGCMAKEDVPAIRAYLERQKEQKPIPTEDEKDFLEKEVKAFLCNYDKEFDDDAPTYDIAEHFYQLGKNSQKPVEWSEEDEKRLKSIIHRIEVQFACNIFGEGKLDVDWLKSLRPQPHWKPSEYMLSLVKKVANGEMLTRMEQMAMETLCNDLQKLL